MKLATLGLAGLIAAGSLTAVSTEAGAAPWHHRHSNAGAFIAGAIVGAGVAAVASQPRYYYQDQYAYEGYPVYVEPQPQPYYVVPSSRTTYYSRDWCRQQGDYNSYTGIVTEASGRSWQCSPPRR